MNEEKNIITVKKGVMLCALILELIYTVSLLQNLHAILV